MIHFDLPKEQSSILKVIGVGGGGSNAVNHMFGQHIEGVNFIICNTDAQAIAQSRVPNKVQLGPHLTQGLGAGANPDIGRQATEESLDEIRNILQVNTKMAFITAGMGGGTGTGGAPIIAKICQDMGILTVGIVTTPFSYEGRKRQLQAEEGIQMLKKYVDTLLVISNDKLRHQFGNLKMKEAFAKADNVLATAAKCITDVINSTGQINVDFADVCTVMKNGGVAILGSAAAEGEARARKAIEEALSSPLLNDNDIRGAKWILININSADGDYEFTMDEVEVIQNYLISQTGQDTDIILGLGYDNNLGAKIGITLIATGFEYKDPFVSKTLPVASKKEDEKITMVLQMPTAVPAPTAKPQPAPEPAPAPPVAEIPKTPLETPTHSLEPVLHEIPLPEGPAISIPGIRRMPVEKPVDKMPETEPEEWVLSPLVQSGNSTEPNPNPPAKKETLVSGGYLTRPVNIYAEEPLPANETRVATSAPAQTAPAGPAPVTARKEEAEAAEMQLIFKEEETGKGMTQGSHAILSTPSEEPPVVDEAEEQRRRAAERIHKLRNLSYNINANDANNEFDTVPAYVRRNLELYNTISPVEQFYSNYEVKGDEQNRGEISTINTFLDGKKPD